MNISKEEHKAFRQFSRDFQATDESKLYKKNFLRNWIQMDITPIRVLLSVEFMSKGIDPLL